MTNGALRTRPSWTFGRRNKQCPWYVPIAPHSLLFSVVRGKRQIKERMKILLWTEPSPCQTFSLGLFVKLPLSLSLSLSLLFFSLLFSYSNRVNPAISFLLLAPEKHLSLRWYCARASHARASLSQLINYSVLSLFSWTEAWSRGKLPVIYPAGDFSVTLVFLARAAVAPWRSESHSVRSTFSCLINLSHILKVSHGCQLTRN